MKKKKIYHNSQPRYSRYGVCPVCRKKKLLDNHRVLKLVVFGSSKKTVPVCGSCHSLVDRSVNVFEAEILQKFASSYRLIWHIFIRDEYISNTVLRRIARKEFAKIWIDSHIDPGPSKARTTRTKRQFRNLTEKQLHILKDGKCPICGKKQLSIHHILKFVVFGENNELGFLCIKCHARLERSITFFESEILKEFAFCYRYIWDVYCRDGNISDDKVRRMAINQFIKVKIKIYGADKKHENWIRNKEAIQKRRGNNILIKNLNGSKAATCSYQ